VRCGDIGVVGGWPNGLFLFEGEPPDSLGTKQPAQRLGLGLPGLEDVDRQSGGAA
jgi:hypothetical protein